MKLSVVIVNYNVKYFLEQALLSVRRASRHLEIEVFVVDNHSVDDSVAMVREKFPEVKLIANSENVGFAVANNQAIRQAKGEYVLLLNPDTVVEEDTFELCLAFMDAHPDAGGLGVRMIDGAGKFLPESKRGFPTPWVAFCKTFGLSRLFPRSRFFNHYHLGYLDERAVSTVEVLAGAFMLLRHRVLMEVGLLDEDFFMYGEDIDLSYRIVAAGYQNYYFPKTTIIHYKGESTRKGSLNYVRIFYQAMIIFARKHFSGARRRLFVAGLQVAIYLRAAVTLLGNLLQRVYLPLLDAVLLFGGLVWIKDFWASYYFRDADYYPASFLYFNAPLYVAIWLTSVYFSGAYDERDNLRRLVRGLLLGTVVLAAVYGFLPLEHRTSRAIIVLGAAWAVMAMVGFRMVLHFFRYGNLRVGQQRNSRLVIVGSLAESERVRHLLQQARVQKNFIGTVGPTDDVDGQLFLSGIDQLDEVCHIYKVDEIIFCSRDVRAQDIMHWMTQLGPAVEYKIVPEESFSIIGSSSRDTPGELYTIDIKFAISQPLQRRNKRLLDLSFAFFLLATFPLQMLLVRRPWQLLANCWQVLAGRKSWVGYAPSYRSVADLPPLRPGLLSPLDELRITVADSPTIDRINFLYAKDYNVWRDWDILWKAYPHLAYRKK